MGKRMPIRVGLHDSDKTRYPNLALMKLSAWHKARGDSVEWFLAMNATYDKVYSSKVFTFTPSDLYLPAGTIKGGNGYASGIVLQNEIEHICPDYTLYGIDYSMGFLTRGCDRNCEWCNVPHREGKIRMNADVEEFLRHEEVVLMDNNVLQHQHGIAQIEKMSKLGVKIDFNQGLDCRLIDDGIARLLSSLKWRSPLRFACDHSGMIPAIHRAVELLRWQNCTPTRYFCYVLVKDIPDAVERIQFLKGVHVDPFAQPYIPPDGLPPNAEQKAFCRWVNHKAEFKSRTWDEYRAAHKV